MVAADHLLTPTTLLMFLLLLIVIGVWLQLAMLRIRLSSRLSRIEERLDEQDHLLDLQSKGLADVAATNEKLLLPLMTSAMFWNRFDVTHHVWQMMCAVRWV